MSTLVGQFANASYLGWRIDNDAWNPCGMVYGTNYSVTTNYNPTNLTSGTTFNWQYPLATAPLTVHAYPSIFFGASPYWGGTNPTDPNHVFPIPVADITSLTSNYNLTLSGNTQGENVAYEFWLTSQPGGGTSTITNAIMIWVHKGAFYPPGAVLGTYNDQYFSGAIYNTPQTVNGATLNFTTIVSNTDALSGTIDIGNILKTLEQDGVVKGTPYLADVELGAEVAEGQGSLTVNSLDLAVRTSYGVNTVLGSGPTATTLKAVPKSEIVLLQNTDGQVALWTIDGSGSSQSQILSPNPGTSWKAVATADFGNGGPDILWQNVDGSANIWMMSGTARVASVTVGQDLGSSWHIEGTGDFNGDGKTDILWQNTSGQTEIWLMNGTSVASEATVGPVVSPSTWHIVATGDFNGDGKSDILWQNTDGQAEVWLMNGTQVMSGTNIGPTPASSWHIVGTGDFNNDGHTDILWQNTSGQAAIWLLNGTSLASGAVVGPNLGSSWHVADVRDANGDGKSDILWQNSDGQMQLWTMNGTTPLAMNMVAPNPGSAWHAVPNSAGAALFAATG